MSDVKTANTFKGFGAEDLDELYLYEAYREGIHRLHSSEYLFDFKSGKYHAFSVARTTSGFWASDGKIVDAVPVFLSKFDKDDPFYAIVKKHLDEEWLKGNLSDGHLEEFDYRSRLFACSPEKKFALCLLPQPK